MSVQANEGPAMEPKEHNPLSAFHPISRPSSSVQVSSSPQVTYSQGMALLETQSTQGKTLCRPTPVHIMNPAVAAITMQQQPHVFNPLTLQLVLHPLHRLGWMVLSLLL